MAVNVSATVTTGSVDVSAQIQTRSVNVSSEIKTHDFNVSAVVNPHIIGEPPKSHRCYYDQNAVMYEGIAPKNSLDTDAVWTVTIIHQNSDGEVTQVETLYNQIWNNYIN